MKDDCLPNNTLASNNCLCHRNIFQTGVNTSFSKMVDHFCPKTQNCVQFLSHNFVQILQVYGPNTYQTMYGRMVQNVQNYRFFDKKMIFFKAFLTKY